MKSVKVWKNKACTRQQHSCGSYVAQLAQALMTLTCWGKRLRWEGADAQLQAAVIIRQRQKQNEIQP